MRTSVLPGQSLGFKVWHSFSRIVDHICHNFESFLKKEASGKHFLVEIFSPTDQD